MQLSDIIIEKIHKGGPISFRDFMDMALYDPELGYYSSSVERIGAGGDYFTSPALTSVFGALIAIQIEEMWNCMGKGIFTIVEYGAGNGTLCKDILNRLRFNIPLYNNMRYCIIEKKVTKLENRGPLRNENVSWHTSIEEVAPFKGFVLSNELLDNFPVHLVVMQNELMEVFVDYKDEEFIEIFRPASSAINNYLENLNVVLPQGFRTEINLQAISWIREIASALEKGFVMTIDYGFTSVELYELKRKRGTLICYKKHNVNECPYKDIGRQDITAHVNFSALYQWGLKNGLQYSGYTDQEHFLHGLGITNYLRAIEENTKAIPSREQESTSVLMLLLGMGNKLKILVQQKGLGKCMLSGLSFSQSDHLLFT